MTPLAMTLWRRLWRTRPGRYAASLAAGAALSVALCDLPPMAGALEAQAQRWGAGAALAKITAAEINAAGVEATAAGGEIRAGSPPRRYTFGPGCLGVRHTLLFLGFMATYIGPRRRRLAFGAAGTLALAAANTLRAAAIAVAVDRGWAAFPQAHDTLTVPVMYTTVFVLWVAYDRLLAGPWPAGGQNPPGGAAEGH